MTTDQNDIERAMDSLMSASIGDETNSDESIEVEAEDVTDANAEIDEDQDDAETYGENVDEDQSDAEEADDADDADEVDADDVDLDEDEADDAEGPDLFPVKIDGKEEKWTLEQLKQSAAGQAKITRDFQENAATRKELDAVKEALQQERQVVLQAAQALQEGKLSKPPTPPNIELLQSDPFAYHEQKALYDVERESYDENLRQVAMVQQQEAAQTQEQRTKFLQEQAAILSERVPEFANEGTRKQFQERISAYGSQYGISSEEIQAVTDARFIEILNDAGKYRDLQNRKAKADAKAKNAPKRKPLKAGAKRTTDTARLAREKAASRLKSSGSIDDAIAALMNE